MPALPRSQEITVHKPADAPIPAPAANKAAHCAIGRISPKLRLEPI